jgi:hypothetical protein
MITQEQRNARAQELMEYAIQERLRQIQRMTDEERQWINVRFDLIGECSSILYHNAYSETEMGNLAELRNSLIDKALGS